MLPMPPHTYTAILTTLRAVEALIDSVCPYVFYWPVLIVHRFIFFITVLLSLALSCMYLTNSDDVHRLVAKVVLLYCCMYLTNSDEVHRQTDLVIGNVALYVPFKLEWYTPLARVSQKVFRCMYLSNSDDIHRGNTARFSELAACTLQTRMMYTLGGTINAT